MKSETGHIVYRPDIDGLRALAILAVVGFHAFPAWVPGGFVGVDIFFVISGFLISGILLTQLQQDTFSLPGFYARRIRRIFPALLAVLVAVLVAGFFLLWPGEYRHLAQQTVGGAGFVINIMLSREAGYFDANTASDPLLHLWSLGVEEQFYIFWPVLLWAGWRVRHHTGIVLGLVFAASFAANIWLSHHWRAFDFYSLPTRFWELLAGGALAWVVKDGRQMTSPAAGNVLSVIGIILIGAAALGLNKMSLFPGWFALLPVGGAVALIVAGPGAWFNRQLLAHPCAVGIGLISYPLYLWHWPLLAFAQVIAGEPPARLIRVELVALAFVLAALTYRLIERPIRTRAITKKQITLLLGLMIAVASAGGAIMIGGGLPARFAAHADAAQLLDNTRLLDDWQKQVRTGHCYLQDAAADRHAPSCIEQKRPLLLLWGDSHAAALYPGLRDLQQTHDFGIVQLTQSGCPPLFDVPKLIFRKNCLDVNKNILAQAINLKPDVILLAAAWNHGDYPMSNDEIGRRLIDGIAQIKKAVPNAKLIIAGPAPRWLSPLPSIYRRSLTFTDAMPPMRLTSHLDPESTALDNVLAQEMTSQNVVYLSLQKKLCDAGGCVTRLGDDLSTLTFIDDGHLSPLASRYVVEALAPDLLTALGIQ